MKQDSLSEAQRTTQTTHRATLRHDNVPKEQVHDPYKLPEKLTDPAVCPKCHAVYAKGHWHWAKSWPSEAKEQLCPACQRIKDNYPAGVVTVGGKFLESHQDEVVNLVRHLGKEEEKAHPLHRIIQIEQVPSRITIKTTDIHLPHKIGHALKDAYAGELEMSYDKEGYFARVNWNRDE